MINIQATIEAASELAQGEKKPSVKLALWVAACSTQQSLEANGRLAYLLRLYVDTPLPENREELFFYLKAARAVLYRSHINALYFIEQAENDGLLDGLENIGQGYIAQCLWRRSVYDLFHGKGLAWKTISLAALIIDPLHCELVPVDRHVKRYLGYSNINSPQREKPYLIIEQEVMLKRNRAGMNHVPLGLYHWMKWEEQRLLTSEQKTSKYKGNGGIESHAALSCRVY